MENFITNFVSIFDEIPKAKILESTKFKEIPDWDSVAALSFIVMVSNEYKKSIDGDMIRSAETIADLFEIINR
jgi:acyl carrier protein